MSKLCQSKLDNSNIIDFKLGEFPWKEPRLSKPADNDLTKRWIVDYGVWSYDEKKIVRKRVNVKGKTVAERLARAKAIIATLEKRAGSMYVGTRPAGLPSLKITPAPTQTDIISPSLPIAKAVHIYIAYSKKALAGNTLKSYRTAVMKLLGYLERHKRSNLAIGSLEVSDVNEFLTELITIDGLSNRTRNNIKGACGTFYNYFAGLDKSKKLKKQGNPFEDPDVRMLPQVQNKHQSYSLPQQKQYREVCESLGLNQLLTFCRWMYYTLMRPHEELRRLRVRDVRTKVIYVSGDNDKTNEGDYVDIPLPLEQLIQQQKIRDFPGHYFVFSQSGTPGPVMVGPKFFYRRHVKVLKEMNLEDSGHDMYSWKHTGAIALWTATKDIELVRQQARHSSIKQTIEYLRDLGVRLADDDKIHKFPVF